MLGGVILDVGHRLGWALVRFQEVTLTTLAVWRRVQPGGSHSGFVPKGVSPLREDEQ